MAEPPARPHAAASILSSHGRAGAEKLAGGGRNRRKAPAVCETRSRPGQPPDRTGARLGEKWPKGKRKPTRPAASRWAVAEDEKVGAAVWRCPVEPRISPGRRTG